MTKQITLLIALTLMLSGSFAQTKILPKSVNDTAFKTARAKKKETGNAKRAALNISAEQEASFKSASRTHRTTIESIEADSALTTQQKKQKRKDARQAFLQELSTFLTPEQIDIVKANRKKEDE